MWIGPLTYPTRKTAKHLLKHKSVSLSSSLKLGISVARVSDCKDRPQTPPAWKSFQIDH